MKSPSIVILMLASWLAGCAGEAGSDPKGTGPGTSPGDPSVAPCTDPAKCCTESDQECLVDPDKKPVCQCYKLWDCSKNPKKCEQAIPVPQGGSNWTCSWTTQKYSCTGTSSILPGGGAWSCSKTGLDQWTCTRPTPPNPSNVPSGLNDWSCIIDQSSNKIQCTKKEPPPPPPGVDAGLVGPPDSKLPLAKVETNCADGIDNDGDGLVDCKDSDCPACPPPPPPGQEICDGKDNNGNGQIDEGGVCNGVGEPCPPGAYQACDCYCGVHRKCQADGTWGPCKVDGNKTCSIAQVTSHSQCGPFQYCDFGKCVFGFNAGACKQHSDCPVGTICDLGWCVKDPYHACP